MASAQVTRWWLPSTAHTKLASVVHARAEQRCVSRTTEGARWDGRDQVMHAAKGQAKARRKSSVVRATRAIEAH